MSFAKLSLALWFFPIILARNFGGEFSPLSILNRSHVVSSTPYCDIKGRLAARVFGMVEVRARSAVTPAHAVAPYFALGGKDEIDMN
ncbi:MAG: hypothetical protein KDJ27_13045 [Gammaproteobacteria bacterium]|nr:hypothetical protein [Gammaproteobacteria bacterium]